MPCLRDAAGSWRVSILSWIYKKNKKKIIWKNTIIIYNILKNTNYKDNFRKKHKKMKGKKNYLG